MEIILNKKIINFKNFALLILGAFFLFAFSYSITKGQAGGCFKDSECPNGTICSGAGGSSGGTCVSTFIAPPNSLYLGDSCSATSSCKQGLNCGSSGKCEAITEGYSCSNDSICQTSKTGLSCVSGKCSAYAPPPSITPADDGPGPTGLTNTPSAEGKIGCNNDPNLRYVNGLCLPKEAVECNEDSIACSKNITDAMIKIIKLLLLLSGMVSVLFLILGGFWYMTSGGNAEQAEKGKNTITNFFLGFVIIIMAYSIVTIVNNLIAGGK